MAKRRPKKQGKKRLHEIASMKELSSNATSLVNLKQAMPVLSPFLKEFGAEVDKIISPRHILHVLNHSILLLHRDKFQNRRCDCLFTRCFSDLNLFKPIVRIAAIASIGELVLHLDSLDGGDRTDYFHLAQVSNPF